MKYKIIYEETSDKKTWYWFIYKEIPRWYGLKESEWEFVGLEITKEKALQRVHKLLLPPVYIPPEQFIATKDNIEELLSNV